MGRVYINASIFTANEASIREHSDGQHYIVIGALSDTPSIFLPSYDAECSAAARALAASLIAAADVLDAVPAAVQVEERQVI